MLLCVAFLDRISSPFLLPELKLEYPTQSILSTKNQCLTEWWVRRKITFLLHREGVKTSSFTDEDFEVKKLAVP